VCTWSSALFLATALIVVNASPLQGQAEKLYVPALRPIDTADLGIALVNPTDRITSIRMIDLLCGYAQELFSRRAEVARESGIDGPGDWAFQYLTGLPTPTLPFRLYLNLAYSPPRNIISNAI
jgi:hypothetical protein